MADLKDIRANPGGGWTVADIDILAQNLGCQVTTHRGQMTITYVTVGPIFTVKSKNPVRVVKIMEFLDWIDLIGAP